MPVFRLANEPDAKGRFSLSKKDQHHLSRVLRIDTGDRFEVRLPDGRLAVAEWIANRKSFEGKILEILTERSVLSLPVWLAVAWIRWPRLEWVVEKATELGLKRLSLLNLALSQNVAQSSDVPKKMERLERIANEALKQCERRFAPHIDHPQSLKAFLRAMQKEAPASAVKIFFWERKGTTRFSASQLAGSKPDLWIILIGPEGGWTDEEVKVLLEHGFQGYSLGNSIYRTETAAIYALANIDFFIGDRE